MTKNEALDKAQEILDIIDGEVNLDTIDHLGTLLDEIANIILE